MLSNDLPERTELPTPRGTSNIKSFQYSPTGPVPIAFDLALTVFVVGALLGFLAFADDRRYRYALLAGLCLGLGVLTWRRWRRA